MSGLVKICGLSTPETLESALAAGADMVGFVRFPRSPRHVALDAGRELSGQVRGRASRVLLLVDADDREIDEAVAALSPDLIQLHGSETVDRVAAIRTRTGRPVMKAVGIGGPSDLVRAAAYRGVADRVLLDAKPPRDAVLPGGNGARFDWSLLAGLDPGPDIMLSGGLDAGNVAAAVAATGVASIDVSSGVESRPGVKDPDLVVAFVTAARAAFAGREDRRHA